MKPFINNCMVIKTQQTAQKEKMLNVFITVTKAEAASEIFGKSWPLFFLKDLSEAGQNDKTSAITLLLSVQWHLNSNLTWITNGLPLQVFYFHQKLGSNQRMDAQAALNVFSACLECLLWNTCSSSWHEVGVSAPNEAEKLKYQWQIVYRRLFVLTVLSLLLKVFKFMAGTYAMESESAYRDRGSRLLSPWFWLLVPPSGCPPSWGELHCSVFLLGPLPLCAGLLQTRVDMPFFFFFFSVINNSSIPGWGYERTLSAGSKLLSGLMMHVLLIVE